MPISDALKRIYATAPVGQYYIETLELRHPGFATNSTYITNEVGGLNAGAGYYQYVPFTIVPPKAGEDGSITMSVVIDNVSKVLMDELESVATAPTEPIILTYRIYLNTSDVVQNDPPLVLDVISVTADQSSISFTAGMTNLRSRPFPSMLYTTQLFPGSRPMSYSWLNKYIGMPYVAGGRDMDGADCYGLVCKLIVRDFRGVSTYRIGRRMRLICAGSTTR